MDYLALRQSYKNSLMHSPKGTTWKDHKYIKKENGRYIYKNDSKTTNEAFKLSSSEYNADTGTFVTEITGKSGQTLIIISGFDEDGVFQFKSVDVKGNEKKEKEDPQPEIVAKSFLNAMRDIAEERKHGKSGSGGKR